MERLNPSVIVIAIIIVGLVTFCYLTQSRTVTINLTWDSANNEIEKIKDTVAAAAGLPREPRKLLDPPSLCDNLLTDITDGHWIRNLDLLQKDSKEYMDYLKTEDEYDTHLARYRIERGIHTQLWREDGKCGFNKYVHLNSSIFARESSSVSTICPRRLYMVLNLFCVLHYSYCRLCRHCLFCVLHYSYC